MASQVELPVPASVPFLPPPPSSAESLSSCFNRVVQTKQELLRTDDLSVSARNLVETELRRARAAATLLAADENRTEALAAHAAARLKTAEARLEKSYVWKLRKMCKGISDDDLPHWVYHVCQQHGLDATIRCKYTDEFLVYTAIHLNAGIIQRNWRRHHSSRKAAEKEGPSLITVLAMIRDSEFAWTKDKILVDEETSSTKIKKPEPKNKKPPPPSVYRPTATSTAKYLAPSSAAVVDAVDADKHHEK